MIESKARRRILVLLFGALVVLGLGGLIVWRISRGGVLSAGSADMYGDIVRSVPVEVLQVSRQDLDLTLSAIGEVAPNAEVLISSKADGLVEKLNFEEGDLVKRGDVLAELEHDVLELDVVKARALLEKAKANLAKAKVPQREQEIRTAEAVLARAKAALEDAEVDLKRNKDLHERGVVSDDEWDSAQLQFRTQEAMYKEALEHLNLYKAGGRVEDIKIAEAEVQEREAMLGVAQELLDDTRIVAEITGRVAERSVDEGERVSVGSQIALIVDISKAKVNVRVSEVDVARIKRGCTATMLFDAFPGRQIEGKVNRIDVSADKDARTFGVEILVDNPGELIRPGMTARVRIVWGREEDAVVIPEYAVLGEGDERFVYAVDSGMCRRKDVRIRVFNSEMAVVAEGLDEGELIALSAHHLIKPGDKLEVVESR